MRVLSRFLLAGFVLASADAHAQSVPLQGGPWVTGHASMYAGQGSSQAVLMDSGPAGGGGIGVGLSELLLTARGTGTPPYVGQGSGPYGTNACDYDAPITNPTGYHFLCWSANVGGNGLIVYGAGGIAAPGILNIEVNGTIYPYPPVSAATGITVVTITSSGTINPSPTSEYIIVQKTIPATTSLILPAASNWPNCPSLGNSCPVYTIKDGGFNASTYPITITAADSKTIDGSSSSIINSNGASATYFLNGSAWFIK